MEQKIELDRAQYEVGVTIDRLAHFYYHTVQTLIEEFGEEEAAQLVSRIVARFGADCGQLTRERVAALGKENSIENHHLGRELPTLVFETRRLDAGDETVKMTEVTHCPYAQAWKKLGFEKWGRLYCRIDQAKYRAYNESFVCFHDENMLDGDGRCVIRVVDTKGSCQ